MPFRLLLLSILFIGCSTLALQADDEDDDEFAILAGTAAAQTIIQLPSDPMAIDASPDGDLLAVAASSSVYLISITDRSLQWTIEAGSGAVRSLSFSHDGTKLAAGVFDDGIVVVEVSSGKELCRAEGHPGSYDPKERSAYGVRFSGDNKMIVSSSWDESIMRLWSAADGSAGKTFDPGFGSEIKELAVSPGGAYLAVASSRSEFVLYKLSDMSELWKSAFFGLSTTFAFSSDGAKLAIGGSKGKVNLYETANGKELAWLNGSGGDVVGLAYLPDGRIIAAADSKKQSVWIWSGSSENQELVTVDSGYRANRDSDNALALVRKGALAAVASDDDRVYVYAVP